MPPDEEAAVSCLSVGFKQNGGVRPKSVSTELVPVEGDETRIISEAVVPRFPVGLEAMSTG